MDQALVDVVRTSKEEAERFVLTNSLSFVAYSPRIPKKGLAG